MYLGVKAVLALSIERIHQANLCNFGILPLIFENEEDYRSLNQGDRLVIEDARSQVENAASSKQVMVRNLSQNRDYVMKLDVTPLQTDMLLKGGRLNQIREALDEKRI